MSYNYRPITMRHNVIINPLITLINESENSYCYSSLITSSIIQSFHYDYFNSIMLPVLINTTVSNL